MIYRDSVNSVVDENENQINNLEHKEEKCIQPEQQRRKKNKKQNKNEDRVRASGTTSSVQHLHHKGARRRIERAKSWKPI